MPLHSTHERCRICLKKTETHVSLHKKLPIDEDDVLMSKILKHCGNVEISQGDRKPQNACFACIENAKVAYRFRMICMQSETTLNTEILNKMINQFDSPDFIKVDDIFEAHDEEISNIEAEGIAEQEESNDCFDNSDDANPEKSDEQEKSSNNAGKIIKSIRGETKCRYCGFEATGTRLGMHMEKNHDDRKTIQCPDCDKRFFHQRKLQFHMLTHTGVKDHTCDVCGKCFALRSNLNSHRKSHMSEKPYKCDTCGMAFVHQAGLRSHEISHTSEPQVACKVCGEAFKRKSSLRRHMLRHTGGERPHPCTLCNRKFWRKCDQKNHMNVHTRELVFKCDVCSKEFYRKFTLQVHMRVHTGERPHVCDACGKTFTQAHCLRSHKASFHPDT